MNPEQTQPPYPDRDFRDRIEPVPESALAPREFRPDEKWQRTLDEIDAMDGIQFELFIKYLLERGAFSDLCTTPASGDQGADLLGFTPEHKKAVVQTKRWRGAVGTSAVQEVLGAMLFYDAEVGFVFTNSSFTNGARALAAKDSRIHLVGRVELGQMIRKVFEREGAPKQNKRTGHSVAVASTPSMAHAPTAQSSPPFTPASPRPPKGRRPRAARGDYRRFRQKPPPLVLVNEPWSAGQWAALTVVLALIVAGVWLYNAGAEQRKWDNIGAAARAVQRG